MTSNRKNSKILKSLDIKLRLLFSYEQIIRNIIEVKIMKLVLFSPEEITSLKFLNKPVFDLENLSGDRKNHLLDYEGDKMIEDSDKKILKSLVCKLNKNSNEDRIVRLLRAQSLIQ